jgi:putative sporulation protein YtaF
VAIIAENQRIASDAGAGIMIVVGFSLLFHSFRKQDAQTMHSSKPLATYPTRAAPQGFLRWLQRLTRFVREPSLVVDWDHSHSIEPREAAVLGIALTLNNVPNGFAAGLIDLSPALTTSTVFIFSLLTLWFGTWFGTRFISRLLRDWAGPAAGVMLVFLGVYELFG